jgi:hypothetical protein
MKKKIKKHQVFLYLSNVHGNSNPTFGIIPSSTCMYVFSHLFDYYSKGCLFEFLSRGDDNWQ